MCPWTLNLVSLRVLKALFKKTMLYKIWYHTQYVEFPSVIVIHCTRCEGRLRKRDVNIGWEGSGRQYLEEGELCLLAIFVTSSDNKTTATITTGYRRHVIFRTQAPVKTCKHNPYIRIYGVDSCKKLLKNHLQFHVFQSLQSSTVQRMCHFLNLLLAFKPTWIFTWPYRQEKVMIRLQATMLLKWAQLGFSYNTWITTCSEKKEMIRIPECNTSYQTHGR